MLGYREEAMDGECIELSEKTEGKLSTDLPAYLLSQGNCFLQGGLQVTLVNIVEVR